MSISVIHHSFVVPCELAGLRLDVVLAKLLPDYSRSRIQHWIRSGSCKRNGAVCTEVKAEVWTADNLTLQAEVENELKGHEAQAIALDIVYEDEAILVLNKAVGLVVHPGNGNRDGTLLNALLHHLPQLEAVPRAGIVHRLDKDTSGLLVIAKNLVAQTDLVRQLQARTVKRNYAAVVLGDLVRGGTIDASIGRHSTQRTRMAVVDSGKEARTHYEVLERFGNATWIECSLETGRTHQIRVHMAHLGHPLLGDDTYRGRRAVPANLAFTRQALHAWRLGLIHPQTQQAMQWQVDLPADLQALLLRLRENHA